MVTMLSRTKTKLRCAKHKRTAADPDKEEEAPFWSRECAGDNSAKR